MKKNYYIFFLLACTLCYSQTNYRIPPYVIDDIKKISFTYDLLDEISDSIFVGWDNFRETSIRIRYENNLQILINYPELQNKYFLYDELNINGQKIFVDTSNVIDVELGSLSKLSGGASPIGVIGDKRIWGLNLRARGISEIEEQKNISSSPEMEITMLIHELTHALQHKLNFQYNAPDLFYDPDLNYSVYSTLEGLALKNAYFSNNKKKQKKYLRDFVKFREEKRSSLDSLTTLSESNKEYMEGMAEYSRHRTYELIEKYPELIQELVIRHNFSDTLFGNIDELKKYTFDYFQEQIFETINIRSKVYHYGLFQAILCNNLFETTYNWYLDKNYNSYDEIIHANIAPNTSTDYDLELLKNEYGYDSVYNHHLPIIQERDSVINLINSQVGHKYTINFKAIRKTVRSFQNFIDQPYFTFNRNYYYTNNISPLEIGEIKILLKTNLVKINWIWDLVLIDKSNEKYQLEYSEIENGNIYKNVKIKNSAFELYAPKVKVVNDGSITKIQLLSKV